MNAASYLLSAFRRGVNDAARRVAERRELLAKRPLAELNRAERRAKRTGGKPWPKGEPHPGERALYCHLKRHTHALTEFVKGRNLTVMATRAYRARLKA